MRTQQSEFPASAGQGPRWNPDSPGDRGNRRHPKIRDETASNESRDLPGVVRQPLYKLIGKIIQPCPEVVDG